MPENPLLPHRRLRELHALMLRCRELERENRQFSGLNREALLAATTIQMEPGDLLCGEDGDATAPALAPKTGAKSRKKKPASAETAVSTSRISRLTMAAGMAQALHGASNNGTSNNGTGNKGVVIALASAGSREPGWAEALTYAQQSRLPLLLLCVDSGARSKGPTALTEDAINKLSRKLFLPTLRVDGEDAVAVYRVMQESFLRGRMGDGPAVVWCLLPKRAASGVSRPIRNMENYLAVRGLKPKKRS